MSVDRRTFFVGAASLAGTYGIFWTVRRALVGPDVKAADKNAGPVTIIQFHDDGTPAGSVSLPKVVKSDADWLKSLNEEQFQVTRHAATEPAFHNAYFQNHEAGLYRCICCDNALFRSAAKYDSGTGWPSFWEPIAEQNLYQSTDSSLFLERTAVACRLCDAHLGHVFTDGPKPTGLRYCMNSASLRFIPHQIS